MKSKHGEREFDAAILEDKKKGLSDAALGRKYGINLRRLEKIVTRTYGINISALRRKKTIRRWEPADFHLEDTSVWSFPNRGSWATHDARYRGNWSPYIPRNVILRYSKPGDIVLDYFCGAGTTAIEAKLLGRNCYAYDINDSAVELAGQNLNFQSYVSKRDVFVDSMFEPTVEVRDARRLSHIPDNFVDLICAHPPYADIIHYTDGKKGDLSFCDVDGFLREMGKVAAESYRVLKPGSHCAILIGDMRKKRHVVPLGFRLVDVFLDAGFDLRELVIKRQHNCKSTGFWYENSIKYNFLLLAHEYLPVFQKPKNAKRAKVREPRRSTYSFQEGHRKRKRLEQMETTTVWLFPQDGLEGFVDTNVFKRYRGGGVAKTLSTSDLMSRTTLPHKPKRKLSLLYVKVLSDSGCTDAPCDLTDATAEFVGQTAEWISPDGHCVVNTRDFRGNRCVIPSAMLLQKSLQVPGLRLKEIVVVSPTAIQSTDNGNDLRIVHSYLLVYSKKNPS